MRFRNLQIYQALTNGYLVKVCAIAQSPLFDLGSGPRPDRAA